MKKILKCIKNFPPKQVKSSQVVFINIKKPKDQ